MSEQIVSIIGSGNIAEAIILGLLEKCDYEPQNIIASGPRMERAAELRSRYGIRAITDNKVAAREGDIVLLSIKPKMLEEVGTELQGKFKREALLVSVLAGKSLEILKKWFSHQFLVRAMPNSPAKTGDGVIMWIADSSISEQRLGQVRQIFGALGSEIQVDNESYLDKTTGVSGSGPAFVFLFMEAMEQAAVHIGLPHHLAHQLVVETFTGASIYAKKSGKHFAELKAEVCSPGGTTVHGVHELEKRQVRAAIVEAVIAAHEQCLKLGK